MSDTTDAEDGLVLALGGGWLQFFELSELETLCLYVCAESRQQITRNLQMTAHTPRTLWTRTPDEDVTPTRKLAPEAIEANMGMFGLQVLSQACISGGKEKAGFNARRSTIRMQAGEFQGVRHHISGLKDEVTIDGLRDPRADGQLGDTKHYSRPWQKAEANSFVSVGRASNDPRVLSVSSVADRLKSRIPCIRVSTVRWEMGIMAALSPEFQWPKDVKELIFYSSFNDSLKGAVFPETIEALTFTFSFNQSLAQGQVLWPPRLKRLFLGMKWDQPMNGARESWPHSIEVLYFSHFFNQPLVGHAAGLPRGLLKIDLGGIFDHPLVGVDWPLGLQSLELSHCFNQSLDGIVFPKCLKEIVLGEAFNQPVDGVTWPTSLQNLVFGYSFNQRIDRVTWPSALRQLALDYEFNMRIDEVLWPVSLLRLTLGHSFNQSIKGVLWPASLEELGLGKGFNQPIEDVAWPGSLRVLVFSDASEFDHTVTRVAWPPRLEERCFGYRFNQPLEGCVLPATLRILRLGLSFTYSLNGVLPLGLQVLLLSKSYPSARVEELPLPPSLSVIQEDPYEVMLLGSLFDDDSVEVAI